LYEFDVIRRGRLPPVVGARDEVLAPCAFNDFYGFVGIRLSGIRKRWWVLPIAEPIPRSLIPFPSSPVVSIYTPVIAEIVIV
jgi:hypothetical protein